MQKELTTFHKRDSRESNISIVSQITLLYLEDEDTIELRLTKSEAHQKGHRKPQTEKREELTIRNLDVPKLIKIAELIENWLDSESSPRFFETVREVNGEYERTDNPDTRIETTSRGYLNSFILKIDDRSIKLSAEHNEDVTLEIPAGEEIHKDNVKDNNHIITLSRFIYDFFKVKYPGEIPIYEEASRSRKTPVDKVELIFERFDKIARQLEDRREDREPLTMDDEYDVQYLLQAILKLYFDDVRDESYLKQHAGVSPRIDYLLEEEKIGIEIKRLGGNRTPKKIRTEIAEDKEQYKSDAMVDKLLCFVYDPDRLLNNPAEFEKDLSEPGKQLDTRLTVIPH